MKTTQNGHSDTTTEGVRVRVGAQFVAENSDPEIGEWCYVYRVIIANEGEAPAQLMARHWVIRDANNECREVRGPGVVGNQPRLEPGEQHEYTSHSRLPTSWGTMEGSYRMKRDDGSEFDARIGRFFLARTTAPLSTLDDPPEDTLEENVQA